MAIDDKLDFFFFFPGVRPSPQFYVWLPSFALSRLCWSLNSQFCRYYLMTGHLQLQDNNYGFVSICIMPGNSITIMDDKNYNSIS